MTARLYVAVCGPGDATDHEVAVAEDIGRLLARAGAVVVCGGLGGVMEAAVRGAASEGGVSLGILPGTDRSAESEGLTVSIPTGMGEGRNAMVVRAADAVIAVGGGYGTLSEIALALRTGVPVVGVRTWQLARDGEHVEAFPTAGSAQDAAVQALDLARERRNRQGA